MSNFHDRFESRSVMRRMAHQAPHLVIAENERLNALVTQLRDAIEKAEQQLDYGQVDIARSILEKTK